MANEQMTLALRMSGVGFTREQAADPLRRGLGRWPADQRWVVLGANGSGKTSLLRIAALYEHPTTGTVEVLGPAVGTG